MESHSKLTLLVAEASSSAQWADESQVIHEFAQIDPTGAKARLEVETMEVVGPL